jgi:hypothetical protein
MPSFTDILSLITAIGVMYGLLQGARLQKSTIKVSETESDAKMGGVYAENQQRMFTAYSDNAFGLIKIMDELKLQKLDVARAEAKAVAAEQRAEAAEAKAATADARSVAADAKAETYRVIAIDTQERVDGFPATITRLEATITGLEKKIISLEEQLRQKDKVAADVAERGVIDARARESKATKPSDAGAHIANVATETDPSKVIGTVVVIPTDAPAPDPPKTD